MATYTRKLIQTRPNILKPFFYPASNVIDKINQYVSEGKAQAIKSVTSEDNLINTLSVEFNTTADWISFNSEGDIENQIGKAIEYCVTNDITWKLLGNDVEEFDPVGAPGVSA